MLRNMPGKANNDSDLTKNLRAFLMNREKPAEAPRPEKRKHLDVQYLFSEVENLLKSMDQADARVQRTMAKFHELKTAIMLSAGKE
jgi:hypothetical protein